MGIVGWYLVCGVIIAFGSAAAAGVQLSEWRRFETWLDAAIVILAWPPIVIRSVLQYSDEED